MGGRVGGAISGGVYGGQLDTRKREIGTHRVGNDGYLQRQTNVSAGHNYEFVRTLYKMYV